MEAGSFETIVAAMVSVQVCTYHYLLIMCTQALAQYRAEKEMRTKKKKTLG